MVAISGDEFVFGSRAWEFTQPETRSKVDPFAIDKFEVTVNDYAAFLAWSAANPKRTFGHPDEGLKKDHTPDNWAAQKSHGARPVCGVDWYDAFAFARWVKKRLPTEHEWERAARGTSGQTFPWGTLFDGTRVHHRAQSPANVGQYASGKSPDGVMDMAGNAREWVDSWFDAYAGGEEAKHRSFGKTHRVLRGGGFLDDAEKAFHAAGRQPRTPRERGADFGFRCATRTR
jgi:formylglycine-generating enzyme required for sulfatase activity